MYIDAFVRNKEKQLELNKKKFGFCWLEMWPLYFEMKKIN